MIHGIISALSSFALAVIDRGGYRGLFFLSLLESMAVPIPSEIVLPFSGYLSAVGRFSIVPVILLASLGNLAGSLLLYSIGRGGGRQVIKKFERYFFIEGEALEKSDEWFRRHGRKTVFFGRILPGIRTFISIAPGIAGMNLAQFSLYTFLGALPWNIALAWVGYKAGQNWNILHAYFRKLDIIVVAAVAGLVVWYIFHRIKHSKHG